MISLRRLFSRLSGSSSRRLHGRSHTPRAEFLEDRCLLAGNVSVANSNAGLLIAGDAQNNELEIRATADGVFLQGVNGTTINGATAALLLSDSSAISGPTEIRLRGGDDRLTVFDGVEFSDSLLVRSGRGGDTISVHGVSVGGNLTVAAGKESNTVILDRLDAAASVTLRSAGALLAGVSDTQVTGDLNIETASGDDAIALRNSSVDGRVTITTAAGDDTVTIQDSILNRFSLLAGKGDDLAQVSETTVNRRAALWMLRGDDSTVIGDGNTISGHLVLGGLLGDDQTEISATSTIARLRQVGQPGDTIDPALIDERIVAAPAGVLPRLDSATEQSRPSLTVTPAAVDLAEGNSVALTVTRSGSTRSALTVVIDGDSDSRVSVPATVDFAAGADSASVDVTVTDDLLYQGDRTLAFTLLATGHNAAAAGVTVTDDETRSLTVSLSADSVAEEDATGVTLSVTRNDAGPAAELTVALSADSTAIAIPNSIVIPGGESAATVTVTPVDNALDTGDITVTITASATDYADVAADLLIVDDDDSVLGLSPTTGTVTEGAAAVQVTIQRAGAGTSAALDVALTSDSSRLTIPATVQIPAGADSVTFDVTAPNNDSVDGDISVHITANSPGFLEATAQFQVIENDLQLTITTDETTTVQSSGTLLTNTSAWTISGTASPHATITADTDDDGDFGDSSATADGDGRFTITLPLTHTTTNRGANSVTLQATAGAASGNLEIPVHYAVGTIIRFETNSGSVDVELLDQDAPITVGNFLTYQTSDAWDNLISHRDVDDFIVQAGGFTVTDGRIAEVDTNPAITNEFNAANSNLRGTLSMATLTGNIDSGTSQWFFNVVDNTFLDDAKHTVFGRVIGEGMTVIEGINQLPQYNLSSQYSHPALGNVPLRQPPPAGVPLTGSLSMSALGNVVTGTGTLFNTELSPGEVFWLNGQLFEVSTVISDTEITTVEDAISASTNQPGYVDLLPADSDFVIFSAIEELLYT